MIDWVVKVLIFLACMELWHLGGGKGKAWCRDVLIPIILGIYVGYQSVWWVGLFTIGSFNIIRIGYGIKDETDDGSALCRFYWNLGLKYSWLVRGTAGALYGISGACVYLAWTICNHSSAHLVYFIYVGVNFVLNAVGEALKLPRRIVERAAGLGVASLVFLL